MLQRVDSTMLCSFLQLLLMGPGSHGNICKRTTLLVLLVPVTSLAAGFHQSQPRSFNPVLEGLLYEAERMARAFSSKSSRQHGIEQKDITDPCPSPMIQTCISTTPKQTKRT